MDGRLREDTTLDPSCSATSADVTDLDWARVLAQHQPMLYAIARELSVSLPAAIDLQDLVQVGALALVDVTRRYRATQGTPFASFARPRVRGAMLDEINRLGGIPRSVRERVKALQVAYIKLEGDLGGPPSNADLARALSLTEEELDDLLLVASSLGTLSLDEVLGADLQEEPHAVTQRYQALWRDTSAPDPIQALFSEQVRQALLEAILRLPPRERRIIDLYYTEGCTFQEIGDLCDPKISVSRVSQLHARAILSLRSSLASFQPSTVF